MYTLEEIDAQLDEIEAEIDALLWWQDLRYLAAEGFIEIEADHLFPVGVAHAQEG